MDWVYPWLVTKQEDTQSSLSSYLIWRHAVLQSDDGTVPLLSVPRSSISENPFTSLLLCSCVHSTIFTFQRYTVLWCQNLALEVNILFFLHWTYNGIILVPLQALVKGNFIYLYTEILKFHQFRRCMLFEKIIYWSKPFPNNSNISMQKSSVLI
jgi:hypothetical protein